MSEIYADNYVKPRVIPVLLVVLLLGLIFWWFPTNITIFGPPWLRGLGFCVLFATLLFFVLDLFHRLWPVHTRHFKDGTKITTFYLGLWREVERTEFADGRPSVYSTSDGRTYINPRELIQSPQFREQLKRFEEFVKRHPEIKPFDGLD